MTERHRMCEPAVQGLVVVDMQVDFFNDGELRRCLDDLVDECNKLIRAAEDVGAPVFVVRTMHAADRSTWSLNMIADAKGMTIRGEPGSAVIDGLDVEGAITVDKTRDSAFFGTELEAVLRTRAISGFALCGVSTESCVAATATDGYARDFEITLVDRATASIDEGLHDHTLRLLNDQYRQPVLQPDQVRFIAPGPRA